jgi:hypothetical protein
MIAPYEIDGTILTSQQRVDFDRTYNLLIDAQHKFVDAMHLSIRNFKKSYQISNNEWIPKKEIYVSANRKIVNGRSWRLGNPMGLRKRKLVESGARNSKSD